MLPPFGQSIDSLNINANDRCFGCSTGYPVKPPGHTPPAFLFPSTTMSNSREALSFQSIKPTKIQPVSPSGTTGVSASSDMNSRQNGRRFGQRRVPQWPLYRSRPLPLSSVCCRLFCSCGILLISFDKMETAQSFQQLCNRPGEARQDGFARVPTRRYKVFQPRPGPGNKGG